MKLYSRNQVVLYSLGTALVVLLLLFGFGVVSFSFASGPDDSAVSKEYREAEMIPTQFNPGGTVREINSGEYSEDELTNIRIYEKYNKAVVNVTTEVVGYNWFLEAIPQEGSSGSGSIIDKRGYVLTNNHVVDKAYKVYVTLADGSQYEGEVVGTDYENDLSVLKFDPGGRDLVTIPFGTSDMLKVGQKVIAIGNPFAFERTLTTGIVSGLGRPLKNNSGLVIRDMIQTDASINPGNSGGALVDAYGNLVGINTAIFSKSGGSQGIGFAIPANLARDILESLVDHGRVIRGWLGLEVQELTPSLAHSFGLSAPQGVVVAAVLRDGPAARAGLRPGDILTAIGGKRLLDARLAMADIAAVKPGNALELRLLRDGKTLDIDVKVGERPIPDNTPAAVEPSLQDKG
nr:MAG: hypothetical protein KVP17_004581 [Porospora cf. gigantea B]